MNERSTAEGVSAEDMAEAWRIAEALMFDRSFALKPLENEQNAQFVDAALEARLVSFELGLRLARNAADVHHADDALDILNEGRVTFTPEQRADPRYHALFRHPKLVKIEAARRKNGVTAGLPVFPVKPYTGR